MFLLQPFVECEEVAFFEEKVQKNIPPMSWNSILFSSRRIWNVTCILEIVCDAKILLFLKLLNFFVSLHHARTPIDYTKRLKIMNITIESSFRFSVSSIQYASSGELLITLTSENSHTDVQYRYTACLGDGQAEEKPSVSLLQRPME